MTDLDPRALEAAARAAFALEHRSKQGWTFEQEAADPALRKYWMDSARAAVTAYLDAMPPPVSPELIAKLNALASRLTEMGEYEAVDLIDTVVARVTPLCAPPAAEAGDGWRDIETAPKDGRDVLVHTLHGLRRVAFWDTARGGLWSLWPGREPAQPTHWRPLPAPPAAQDPRQPEIRIGQFVIRHAPKGIWIGRPGGEGGEFATADVEAALAQFYRANF